MIKRVYLTMYFFWFQYCSPSRPEKLEDLRENEEMAVVRRNAKAQTHDCCLQNR